MKKKIHYEANPFGKVKLGKKTYLGRLPTPEELAATEHTTKVTLALSTGSLRQLKDYAHAAGIPYQVMIRRLIDAYVTQTSGDRP